MVWHNRDDIFSDITAMLINMPFNNLF